MYQPSKPFHIDMKMFQIRQMQLFMNNKIWKIPNLI